MPKKEKKPKRGGLDKGILRKQLDELTALYELSRPISSTDNLDSGLGLIAEEVAASFKADICIIYVLDKGKILISASYGIKRGSFGFVRSYLLRRGPIARVIKAKRAVRIDDMSRHNAKAIPSIPGRIPIRSLVAVPLIRGGRAVGALVCCCKKEGVYAKEDENRLALFAVHAVSLMENTHLLKELKDKYLSTIRLLASVIDSEDAYTEGHSESVMRLAVGIANTLGLSDKKKSIIRYASLLHDIGKVSMDTHILKKPGPLTREEWARMKRHPRAGVDIIKRAGFLDTLIPAILYHHVRYSGGGYPFTRKKKERIPVEARILAVADAYESMTSDRPYRKHMSREEAAEELTRCSGTQFDPKVVKALLKYLNK